MKIWMSFVKREDEKSSFLGACVVEITDEQIKEALEDYPGMADPVKGSQILAAAREALRKGCNPGGEILGMILKEIPPGVEINRLYSKDEVREMGIK